MYGPIIGWKREIQNRNTKTPAYFSYAGVFHKKSYFSSSVLSQSGIFIPSSQSSSPFFSQVFCFLSGSGDFFGFAEVSGFWEEVSFFL